MSFTLFQPTSIEDAIALQKTHMGSYLAGGTIIMVNCYRGKANPSCLISLENIQDLYGIRETETELRIGAQMTCDEIEHSDSIKNLFFALWKAASEVGGPQVRHRATIAGNIAGGSPSSDLATPLLALGAELEIIGDNSTRRIPVEEFFLGFAKTALSSEEIISAVILTKHEGTKSAFAKVGKRNALAVSNANLAIVRYKRDDVTTYRVAAGAVAPCPTFCKKTSALLSSGASIKRVCQAIQEEISPIDDRWATAEYRREVISNILEQYLTNEEAYLL